MTMREKIDQQLNNLAQIIQMYTDENFSVQQSISETDYGCSGYLNVCNFATGNWFKFRVSDHVASSHRRIFTEFMLRFDAKISIENEVLCNAVEQFMRPERFEVVRTVKVTNNIKRHTVPADAEIKPHQRIVGKRIASTGRPVIDIEWNEFYIIETIERKK